MSDVGGSFEADENGCDYWFLPQNRLSPSPEPNRCRYSLAQVGLERADLGRARARAAWLCDVRRTLEAHGIGWTVWDYRGGFGIDARLARPCAAEASMRSALGVCAQPLRPID